MQQDIQILPGNQDSTTMLSEMKNHYKKLGDISETTQLNGTLTKITPLFLQRNDNNAGLRKRKADCFNVANL